MVQAGSQTHRQPVSHRQFDPGAELGRMQVGRDSRIQRVDADGLHRGRPHGIEVHDRSNGTARDRPKISALISRRRGTMPPNEYTDWRRVAVPETDPEADASKVVKP